eukprot:CAMPEP_0170475746 /NCGR_PEP_ID=MMETSP0123-20130129/17338_1 /TAXON_ID=182087 /ORGANISM="Favella ehrenbergii, Strain Fehren 1" /LENGTH=34 /DNA_ID= /DNA_START= /DNA_END= /DNA_ORIENTATION=
MNFVEFLGAHAQDFVADVTEAGDNDSAAAVGNAH